MKTTDIMAVVRVTLLILVLLTVALVSALTAMHFAIHGREVEVPNLIGLTPADAERVSLAAGLQIEVQREYYSANVAAGKVMSQVPPAGTKVKRGFEVRLARSIGPQRVTIPDVTGQTSRAAQINLERRGLDVGTTALVSLPGATPDQVMAQSPPANANGVSAPRISLLIGAPLGAPAFITPNFVGQPLGAVTNLVQAAGMRIGKVSVVIAEPTPAPVPQGSTSSNPTQSPPSPTNTAQPVPAQTALSPSPSSLILSQNPAAGQKISLGDAIDFEVSR